jgi:hypothetical protein
MTQQWFAVDKDGLAKQLAHVPKLRRAELMDCWEDARPYALDLIIHEFGHFDGSNHMQEQYWKNLSFVGARVVEVALNTPELFR